MERIGSSELWYFLSAFKVLPSYLNQCSIIQSCERIPKIQMRMIKIGTVASYGFLRPMLF